MTRPAPGRLRLAFVAAAALLSSLVALGVLASTGLYFYAERSLDRLPPEALPHLDTACGDTCTFLVIGSDSREGLPAEERERLEGGEPGEAADTVMLVRLEAGRDRPLVVQIPRDLWVTLSGGEEDRLADVLGTGPDAMVETVERLAGIEVDHYVEIGLAGFERLVDRLGGVRICVDRPVVDPTAGLSLDRGCQSVGGREALAFVRARHILGECFPDRSRIARQQRFLEAVLRKVLSPGSLLRLPSLASALAGSFRVDSHLSMLDVLRLANDLRAVGTSAVEFRVVPGVPAWEGTSLVLHQVSETAQLFGRLRQGASLGDLGQERPDRLPEAGSVRVVLVDEESEGKAGKVSERLTDEGFDTRAVEPGPIRLGHSAILYRPGKLEAAVVVQRTLRSLSVEEAPAGLHLPGDVAVVITASYERRRPDSEAEKDPTEPAEQVPSGPRCE